MKRRLLLWDIDGTMISTSAGKSAFVEALRSHQVEDDLQHMSFAGQTDPLILGDICRLHPHVDREELLATYLEILPQRLASTEGKLLPGVVEILEWCRDHPLLDSGLLTGNVQKGAFHKLSRYKLDHFFTLGAFGDDGATRNDLGPVALERARTEWNHPFTAGDTWIIGDTPHDIACARAMGAQVLAVTTGSYSREELEPHKPDGICDGFSELEGAMALFSEVMEL